MMAGVFVLLAQAAYLSVCGCALYGSVWEVAGGDFHARQVSPCEADAHAVVGGDGLVEGDPAAIL